MANIDIKGMIFDYGGTLDSRGDHWSHIILEAYRAAGLRVDVESFKEAYIEGERELAVDGVVAYSDNFLELMRKKVAVQLRYLGVPFDSSGYVDAIAGYCYTKAKCCTDEAKPVLAKLSKRYPLAIVSNFYGNLDTVISDFGIDIYFKAVIESASVGVRKPDPAIFRLGVEALGLQPEHVLVVGDSYSKDILPALSIGCQAKWIKGRQWPPG